MNDDVIEVSTVHSWTRRKKMLLLASFVSVVLVLITIAGALMPEESYAINYGNKYAEPSLQYIFGTDHMGRDMLYRCIKGLSISIQVGLLAAFVSSCIALVLGTLSATFGGKVDAFILWLVDLCMGVPHILLILMISVSLGGGMKGVVIGVVATHWTRLTRLIRAEVMQLRKEPYVLAARNYGHSYFRIAKEHFVPHVLPQYIIGLVLLFPHAILHEAGITFLGYGLPLDLPAIGIILSESIRHISLGLWWLAFFPGMTLMVVVFFFDRLGEALKELLDPAHSQR